MRFDDELLEQLDGFVANEGKIEDRSTAIRYAVREMIQKEE